MANRSYKASKRNFSNVRHEEIRSFVDETFGTFHDQLSAAYYEERELVLDGTNFGVLSKEEFNALHTLAHDIQTVAFHHINLYVDKRSKEFTKIPEEEYRFSERRDESGEIISTKDLVQQSLDRISETLQKYPSLSDYEFTIENQFNNQTITLSISDLRKMKLK